MSLCFREKRPSTRQNRNGLEGAKIGLVCEATSVMCGTGYAVTSSRGYFDGLGSDCVRTDVSSGGRADGRAESVSQVSEPATCGAAGDTARGRTAGEQVEPMWERGWTTGQQVKPMLVREAMSVEECELVSVVVVPGPGVFGTDLSRLTRHPGSSTCCT